MPERVYECDRNDHEKLKKLLEYDPYLDKSISSEQLEVIRNDKYANIIFARQSYVIKDGSSLGMDAKKYYLYLKAGDEFFKDAEEKLKKEIASIKRSDADTEKKIIAIINEEENKGNYGIGLILGG
jgi:hypothetical protein